jgi:hypothetical protein
MQARALTATFGLGPPTRKEVDVPTATKEPRGALGGASDHVGHTVQATVTEPPSRPEVVLDAVLLAAAVAELVSPTLAIAGMALNRLVHVAK